VLSELEAPDASEAFGLLDSISFLAPAGVGLRGLFGVGALDGFPASGIGDNALPGTLSVALRDAPILSSATPTESSDIISISSRMCRMFLAQRLAQCRNAPLRHSHGLFISHLGHRHWNGQDRLVRNEFLHLHHRRK
jgi:hypothetical protein